MKDNTRLHSRRIVMTTTCERLADEIEEIIRVDISDKIDRMCGVCEPKFKELFRALIKDIGKIRSEDKA